MLFRPTTKHLKAQLVADALEHFWDYAYLGNHPLAELTCVTRALAAPTRATHLERGHALHYLLRRAIDATQVPASRRHSSHEAFYHPILHHVYIEGTDNPFVAKELNLAQRTFYRYLAKALAVVTQLLDDWECAARREGEWQ